MLAHPWLGAAVFCGVLAACGFAVVALVVGPAPAIAAALVGWVTGTVAMSSAMRRADY